MKRFGKPSIFIALAPLFITLVFSSIAGSVLLELVAAESPAPLPAFPGAQGGGAASIGGRGGRVIEVTNLNDSGPGSFREAVSASGPRIVVFRTGGIINLLSPIRITNPYLTIAGQTAPGGGILLKGAEIQGGSVILGIRTHDVIIRYIRFRYGYSPLNPPGSQKGKCIDTSGGVYNVMIDHCSFSWAADENITLWTMDDAEYRNITIQNCISSEGLKGHACGFIAGAQRRQTADKVVNVDVHHCFFAHNQNRNPLIKVKCSQVVNNIIYNWEWYASGWEGGATLDIVGNFYKKGPSSSSWPEVLWLPQLDGPTGDPSIYIAGNIGPTNPDGSGDNWLMIGECEGGKWVYYGKHPSSSYRRYTPIQSDYPIIVHNARDLEGALLVDVGASRRLDENGTWITNRDSVDTRVISDYINRTGSIIAKESEVGGFPYIEEGIAYEDSDHDGMPNVWERRYGLNPGNADDGNGDADGDGYTNIEEFLNGTNPLSVEGESTV